MTSIHLHGILAKEFGKEMVLNIRKPKEIFNAIDCNKPNFIKRVFDLAKEGIHYSIIVDGQNIKEMTELSVSKQCNRIDIVPAIVGAGPAIAIIGLVALIAGTVAEMALVATLGSMLLGIGLQMMLAPKPKPEQRPEATVSGLQDSFVFSSKANLAQQGIPVPVGYGRLRVGSAIIQSTIKSYPQKVYTPEAMQTSAPINSTNTTNPTSQAIISSITK